MGKISRLSNHLSNLIAAGEVVERPSSVVKELVENSIDADATRITISLIDSGIKEINIIDNGCGMSSVDALESFARHSTSKIKSEYDLSRIITLGFRGEAIPSIASVSCMRIITNDGSGGFEVSYEAGTYMGSASKPCSKGTNILVKDLFFNTPARLKHLKSLSSELASTTFLIARFALSFPNISFTLLNNNKEIIKTSGNDDLVRLFGETYGLEVAKNLVFKEYESNAYKIKLVLAKPSVTRTRKDEVTLITNNRYVKSYPISNALILGYNTYLTTGRYPIACIYLTIDPTLIDVNVHPSKQVIKISKEEEICDIITNLTKEALDESDNIAKAVFVSSALPKDKGYVKESIFDLPKVEEPILEKPKTNSIKEEITNTYSKTINLVETKSIVEKSFDNKATNNDSIKNEIILEQEIKQEVPIKLEEESIIYNKLPVLNYIGSLRNTYLMFETDEGLMLIDQHAAAERINYEKYHDILSSRKDIKEELLIPYNMDFSKEEVIFLEDNLNIFEDLGFSLDLSGNTTFMVRKKPRWCLFDELDSTIRRILNLAMKNKKIYSMYFLDEVCKMISCKDSIKANKSLNDDEIKALISNLEKCKNPFKCPHGRPTLVKVTENEILKMFKRL